MILCNYDSCPTEFSTVVPDEVEWGPVTAATYADLTSHHAVVQIAGINAGYYVDIVGLGDLWFNAVQIALALCAEVYASTHKKRSSRKNTSFRRVYNNYCYEDCIYFYITY